MIFRLSSVCLAWLIMLSMPGRAQNLRLATSIININIISINISINTNIIMAAGIFPP